MTHEIPPADEQLAAVRQLPPRERIGSLSEILLLTPPWNEAFDAMHRCYEESQVSSEPEGMLLVGPTGAGKTTLFGKFAQQFPKILLDYHLQQHVVTLFVYPAVTEKMLATGILAALEDPRPSSGTLPAMTRRIVKLFYKCQVRMLILDEIHHIVDRQNNRLLTTVSDWLKTLLKETGVSCVLVGLPYADQILVKNEQLARMFSGPWILPAYTWEKADPDTTSEFETLMHQLELLLPFNEPSGLDELDLAWRCYVASDGVISNLMRLIRRAGTLALSAGQEHLDRQVLATAYIESLRMIRRGVANPFVADTLPDYQKAAASDPGIVGGVSGRGQRHQPPQQGLKDVM